MLMRIFVGIIILMAIIVGMLALSFSQDHWLKLIMFRDFFDITLPILGFGALVKYLCTSNKCKSCGKSTN